MVINITNIDFKYYYAPIVRIHFEGTYNLERIYLDSEGI